MMVEKYRELYELAIKIKQYEPWEKYWDGDLFEVTPDGCQESFYCSIMGKNEQCYGITIYKGSDGYADFCRLANKDYEYVTSTFLMGNQNCITCYFDGYSDQINDEELDVIDELGYDFNEGSYIFFLAFKKRHFPINLSDEQVDEMIDVFKCLLETFAKVDSDNIQVDWENYEIIEGYYEDHELMIDIVERPKEPRDMYPLVLNYDRECLENIDKRNNMDLVVDLDYIFVPTFEGKNAPSNTLLLVFYDRSKGLLLNMRAVEDDENEVEAVVDDFLDLICEYGYFDSVIARNPVVLNALYTICDDHDMGLYVDSLEEIDEIFEDIRNMKNDDEPSGILS